MEARLGELEVDLWEYPDDVEVVFSNVRVARGMTCRGGSGGGGGLPNLDWEGDAYMEGLDAQESTGRAPRLQVDTTLPAEMYSDFKTSFLKDASYDDVKRALIQRFGGSTWRPPADGLVTLFLVAGDTSEAGYAMMPYQGNAFRLAPAYLPGDERRECVDAKPRWREVYS